MSMSDREDRALERGAALAARIERVGRGVYAVPSQSQAGELHLVTDLGLLGIGQGLVCDCEAASFGQVCADLGALVLRRQQEARRGLSQRSRRAGARR